MSKERERQVLLLSDAANTSSRVVLDFSDGVDTEVRQLTALEVAPERVDGVGVGRVGAESLDDQIEAWRGEERVHLSAPVAGRTVLEHGDRVTVELATQLADEGNHARVDVGPGSGADHDLGP